jgi:hypothetical protein
MNAAADGMRLGLCLAAFGGTDLRAALAEVAGYGPLCLDLPTDTTLGLRRRGGRGAGGPGSAGAAGCLREQ